MVFIMRRALLLSMSLALILSGCNQRPSVLEYEISGDSVTITACDRSASGELVIPDTIKGKPVTAIGPAAFALVGYYEPSITKATENTFGEFQILETTEHPSSDNPTLERIVIPDSVTSIGTHAFLSCVGLKSITIPDSVTSIGERTFEGCVSLTSITIPDGVTSIGTQAFRACTALTSITIPDSVTSIGERAFSGCVNLTAATFLGDAPEIAQDAFTHCSFTIYRKPEAKGWSAVVGDRPVTLIGETPTEKPIVATPPAKTDKKFPSSTKELMFGSKPVVTDKDKAFWEAAKSGKLEAVQRLLSEGVDVDIYGSTVGVDFGCTALFWAAKHNHKEVVQFLLEKDAYIDAGAGMGGAPLHIAAYEGHSEIVELLISEGANAEAKTGDGKTVIDFANEEIAALIRKSIEEKQK